MVIILNKKSCGGKGLKRWNMIKDYISTSQTEIITLQESGFENRLRETINQGETKFIAAGGDGTVNLLLNYLIEFTTRGELSRINLGAIGIGSSNDFHKPFCSKIGQIPICMDFQNACYRDVGILTYGTTNSKAEKYFLINASIGITAQANHLFNNPDRSLRKLKIMNTKSAIIYSALKTIIGYKNINAQIESGDFKFTKAITNLGVTKSSHFSDDFCYDSNTDYTDGKFNVHLAYDMNRYEVLNLMNALKSGRFSKLKKTKTWQTNKMKITSPNKFAVEFDGEVVMTNKVEFKVLNKFIKVCGNGKRI